MDKRKQILDLVKEFIREKRESESWVAGQDWVQYSGPYFDENEYVAAIDSLLSEWLIFGTHARNFEKVFPELLGKKHGAYTNSGSSANLLMVASTKSKETYNLKNGDKVITPVVCFPTTINPIIQNNLTPVFVDVELPNLNLNLDQVENLLKNDKNKEIKAIMFAHVLGNPPDMDRLMDIIHRHNLIFLEDACDALGSTYDGKKLGSFGDISSCSFFPAHHMTTGEGGFVATDNQKVRKVLASVRDWGRACYCNTAKPGSVVSGTACGNRFKNWLPGMPEAIYDHRYVFDEIGYNLKPLDLQAAIGIEQIKKLPEMDLARRNNFNRLKGIFSKYKDYFELPYATKKADPCWFGFLMTVKKDAPFSKDDVVRYLESKKIQTRSYFAGNILVHPGYIDLNNPNISLRKEYPVADIVTTNTFFLGTYIGLTEQKMRYIEECVDEFFEEVK